MDARKRVRAAAVAAIVAERMPDGLDVKILAGSGPTIREIASTILAIEAVTTVKGDVATAAAAVLEHVGSGRAERLAQTLVKAPVRRYSSGSGKPAPTVFNENGMNVVITINRVEVTIRVPSTTKYGGTTVEHILLSHAENRCILKGDASALVDEARLDGHIDIIAEEMHRRHPSGLTRQQMLEEVRLKIGKIALDSDFIRMNVDGAPWQHTGLYRDELNHQSIDVWRADLAQEMAKERKGIKTQAKITAQATAIADIVNARLLEQGRAPDTEFTRTAGHLHVEMPTITESLTMGKCSFYASIPSEYLEKQLEEEAATHITRTAMLGGRSPAVKHEEVPLEIWRFDPVLLAMVEAHSPDPHDSLRRIVFSELRTHDAGAKGPIGPDAPGFQVRVGRGEVTVRLRVAAGIAWSHGSVTIDIRKVAIPEQMVGAMQGRRLGEILSHPLLPEDACIVNATIANGRTGGGTVTMQTRREVLPATRLPMAA